MLRECAPCNAAFMRATAPSRLPFQAAAKGRTMDYHTGRLTSTSDDVAAWAALALRALRRRFQRADPACRLASAAQQDLAHTQHLLKQHQLRAAGAGARGARALHRKHVARRYGRGVRPSATIAHVQDTLRAARLLSRPQGRRIGTLGALCTQGVPARPEPPRRAAVAKRIGAVAQLRQAAGKEAGDV